MYQETHDNFKDKDSANKQECREAFISGIEDLNLKQLRYVGLPARKAIVEKELLQTYFDAKLFLVETHKDIFKEQQKLDIFDNLTVYQEINHENKNLFDCEVPFEINAIWMDLCGFLTPKTFEGIIKFIKSNKFEKKAIFAITLGASRERPESKELFNEIQQKHLGYIHDDLKNFRQFDFPIIFEQILSNETGNSFKHSLRLSYKNEGPSQPMTFYSFKSQ